MGVSSSEQQKGGDQRSQGGRSWWYTSPEEQARLDAAAARGRASAQWREDNTRRIENNYADWKNNNPGLKLALDILPGTGQVMSARDVYHDIYKQNLGAALIDALGLIPGAKLVQGAGMVKNAVQRAGPLWRGSRLADALADTYEYFKAEPAKPGGKQ